MDVSVTIKFKNIPDRFHNRVNAIMEDGKITDSEMIELTSMKLDNGNIWPEPISMTPLSAQSALVNYRPLSGTGIEVERNTGNGDVPHFSIVRPEVIGRIQRDRPLLRKLVWLAIVGPVVIAALIKVLS